MRWKKISACLLALAMATMVAGCENTVASAAFMATVQEGEIPQEALYPVKPERVQLVGQKESVIEYDAPYAYVLEYPKMGMEKIDGRIGEIVQQIRSDFDKEYRVTQESKTKTNVSQKDCNTFLYLDYDSYLVNEEILSIVFFENHEVNTLASAVSKISVYHFNMATGEEISEEDLMKKGFREKAATYTKKYFSETEPFQDRIFGDYETTLAPDSGRYDRFALSNEGVVLYFDRYDIFPGSMGIVKLIIPFSAMQGVIAGAGEDAPDGASQAAGERVIDPEKPMVALTFDDGPNPKYTNRILDVMEKYNVVATFFDLGSLVESYPETVQREVALGCEVGSHSYSHNNFFKLSNEAIAKDVHLTAEAFQEAIGTEPTLFRPPYGNCDDRVKQHIPLGIVTWSVDTLDWKSKNVNAIMKAVKAEGDLDGKVILMHGIYETSAAATEQLVPYLLDEGYQLVTVSEMLEIKHGITPEANVIYGYHYFQ